MSLLLNPRVIASLALALFLAFTHFAAYRTGRNAVQVEWDAAMVEQERSARTQKDRNIELQRAAEKRYTVTREAQDRFIVTTVREIAHDAAPLAACPVPEPVRVRLNAVAACARSDSPAACGATADAVPRP